MSYQKMMKWNSKHRKGTRQPIIMSTGSGFWASTGFLEMDYLPYVKASQKAGIEFLTDEQFYYLNCNPHILSGMSLENIIKYCKLMAEKAKQENKSLYQTILGI